MAKIKIYTNFSLVNGPFGGANSFLRTLSECLEKKGVTFTNSPASSDLIFLNALTKGDIAGDGILNRNDVEALAKHKKPIVHRKVNYRASGSQLMRSMDERGNIHGDLMQLGFSDLVTHHIFQSRYSYEVFSKSGFDSSRYSVVLNGVDTSLFNTKSSIFPFGTRKSVWLQGAPLKAVISTWSRDEMKGFKYYRELDSYLTNLPDVTVDFVGRSPEDHKFQNFRIHRAKKRNKLASFLKRHHIYLQFAHHETCSNALIEALSCGLPTIYLDSGSNKEIAGEYGVCYSGDWQHDFEEIRASYGSFYEKLRSEPFSIDKTAAQYLEVFAAALAHK